MTLFPLFTDSSWIPISRKHIYKANFSEPLKKPLKYKKLVALSLSFPHFRVNMLNVNYKSRDLSCRYLLSLSLLRMTIRWTEVRSHYAEPASFTTASTSRCFFFLILYEQTITNHYRNLQFIAIKSNCLISYRAGAWYYLIFADFLNSGFKMASKTKVIVCS